MRSVLAAIGVSVLFCSTASFATDTVADAIKERAAECAAIQKKAEAEATKAGRPIPPPKPCQIGFVGVDKYPEPKTPKQNQ